MWVKYTFFLGVCGGVCVLGLVFGLVLVMGRLERRACGCVGSLTGETSAKKGHSCDRSELDLECCNWAREAQQKPRNKPSTCTGDVR